jgi:hypothetical protein
MALMRKESLEEGIELGRGEGLELGRGQDIRNLLVFGMTPEQVSEALRLPLGTVMRYQSVWRYASDRHEVPSRRWRGATAIISRKCSRFVRKGLEGRVAVTSAVFSFPRRGTGGNRLVAAQIPPRQVGRNPRKARSA